jgi:hypothetical protein
MARVPKDRNTSRGDTFYFVFHFLLLLLLFVWCAIYNFSHLARRIFWKQTRTTSWGTQAERRQFFVDLAEELGFNPYIGPNWYSIPRASIIQKQVFYLFYFIFVILFSSRLAHSYTAQRGDG